MVRIVDRGCEMWLGAIGFGGGGGKTAKGIFKTARYALRIVCVVRRWSKGRVSQEPARASVGAEEVD